mgnify:CR=1 FL=1
MEFHVSRQARDRYGFDQSLFSLSGNVLFADFRAARAFAQKINDKRDLLNHPDQTVWAGQINAMGLIDEILHYVVGLYRRERNPQAMSQALAWVKERVGRREVERALVQFAMEFPPLAVYRGEQSLAEYYAGTTDGIPNEQVLLEEMLMLWLANKNAAFAPFEDLFTDEHLAAESAYLPVMAELYRFFDTQPPFGPDSLNLIDMLRSPAVAVPHSLFGQLEFIRDRWAELLGPYLRRLLSSLDLIREEEAAAARGAFFGPGPVEIPLYDLAGRALEVEAFSPDRDWMPRLVLIAKSTYVWLDQLSKQYQRPITRLDQIPDEELLKLARWGITGLWLIGLWERSRASARIKQMMGNPEAIASAYSLFEYRIADDLGGEEAYSNLRERAWRCGIRLASDMVPNHMAIDSPWVADHPDWFLSLDYSPFPSYSFTGPDFSSDSRVSIYLEDHYFDRTDAAVVFKLVDHRDGRERYVYHGNDGTSIPWNDTAQLNYLNPQVREAVIQTILSVARRFPIIRFDAAMTLAKMHYQRLWFPAPGSAGAIPSRAEHGMTKEEFDAQMPVEFWREVVDRVAQEVPDTLLLAEAFWLMEGYFVRTLGMHRVYNSAFMNLLRDEENAKYRLLMKNTLEFDPEILKRYVNFMNNPDERTAVDQFGKGDKYFGITTLMSTMPGLPMFGHGQVEGFSEKYGMEFKRAYWNEQPDQDLINRHVRQIFPLLHRRALFAGVENFLLYDFFTPEGVVNENVFAYSNGLGSERALVVYHNKFADTRGWVRTSAGFLVKAPNGERYIIQRTLGEGLNLHADPRAFCIYRDVVSGLEYIVPSLEIIERGMYLELGAYQHHVYLDFREVIDDEWGSYRRLTEYLGGRGAPSIDTALQELLLRPVLQPFREIANPGYFHYLLASRLSPDRPQIPTGLLDEAQLKAQALIAGIETMTGPVQGREAYLRELRACLRAALELPILEERYPFPRAVKYHQAIRYLQSGFEQESDPRRWLTLFGWAFLHHLGKLKSAEDYAAITLGWLDEWHFARAFREAARGIGLDEKAAEEAVDVLRLLIAHQSWFDLCRQQPIAEILAGWLKTSEIQHFLRVNEYQKVLWFHHERFVTLVWWMALIAVFQSFAARTGGAALFVERLLLVYALVQQLLAAEEKSDYQVHKLLAALKS